MTHLTIDNKKYVIVPEENYKELQRKAALKWTPEKTFSIEDARAYSKKLIRQWASFLPARVCNVGQKRWRTRAPLVVDPMVQ